MTGSQLAKDFGGATSEAFGDSDEQFAFAAESLDQEAGRDTRFGRDVGEGEFVRPALCHRALRRRENVFVGDLAWSWAHALSPGLTVTKWRFRIVTKRIFTNGDAMRKVIYGGASSLDGFFTGPNGEMDWLYWSSEVSEVMAESFASTDTMIFGRKTWEFAQQQGGGPGMPGIKGYVCSRTLTALPAGGVELVADAAGLVKHLKGEEGKDIVVMSGGNLARSLFDADLIDEVGLNIHPVLLGAGVPAFLDAGRRVNLELSSCKQLGGGCVQVGYRVKR